MESYDRSLLSRTLLPALLWLLAQLPAFAAAPDPAPIPRLETGGHTAPIKRIAVDRAGRWLVTAADDKTARVWDLQTGKLVQVLRPPIGGDADEGKLYAVAISPDGATVAVGGFTAAAGRPPSIYLFDRATGALRRALGGLPNVVNHLAWSPDGQRLAATLYSGGLRVYDPAELR
ncbi:MAG: hypothetical protein EKK65_06635 [Lysobacterales bacterium]|nr:MAG: hypothetical protein EKK65_06635 [Xanthomonadales bacterium]